MQREIQYCAFLLQLSPSFQHCLCIKLKVIKKEKFIKKSVDIRCIP